MVQGIDAAEARRAWYGVAAEAAKPHFRVRPDACSHARMPKGAVWSAADAGNVPALVDALRPRTGGFLGIGGTGGGSTEEADAVG